MIEAGLGGVTLFGTTGEGASIGFDERAEAIAAVIESGVAASQVTLGLCGSAVGDVAAQVAQGLSFGVNRFLLLPPFYFKGVDDGGLMDWHAELFARVDPRATFILYHIPQLTQIPLSIDLVLRLRAAFPDRVVAIKDSAGNWDNTKALLEGGDIAVLVGDERLLHKAAALGAAGSICGMANLYPQRLKTLFETQTQDAALSAEVDSVVSVPVVPALKLVMALRTGDASWGNLRAPLQPLTGAAQAVITETFAMEGAT